MKNKNKLVKDLVSILIPVYNVEKYLPDLFLSVENQTYPKIEVIFVNDGSTDNSLKLLKDFCNKHSYARVISQKNMGLPSARNTAIKHAHGEFVYILDSDDMMNINAINTMYHYLIKTNSDLVTSNFKYILNSTPFKRINQKCRKQPKITILKDNDLICSTYLSQFKSSFTRTLWNKLLKTSLIQTLVGWPNVWDPKIACGEDNYFLSKYLLKCKRVCCIDDALYYYRKRNSSISREQFNPKYYMFMFSSKNFLSLDEKKYEKTIGNAQALQSSFANWLLCKMYKSKFYDEDKIKWLYNEYIKYLPKVQKYWNHSKISILIEKNKTNRIYKKLLNLKNKHEKRKN